MSQNRAAINLNSLHLARYHFHFRVTQTMRLPDYAGSALRGVFGRALMQLSGLHVSDVKNKSPLFLHSPYAEVFEPQPEPEGAGLLARLPDIPPPYVIEAPVNRGYLYEPEQQLSFSMVLTQRALAHLPLIILAWRRALLMGIGQGHSGKAELVLVEHEVASGERQSIYSEDKPRVVEHDTLLVAPEFTQQSAVHVRFYTPLRIQHQGRVIGAKQLSAAVFLRHVIRRYSIFWQLQFGQSLDGDLLKGVLSLADSVAEGEKRLSFRSWKRFSARQQQLMHMDGVVGRWLLPDVAPQLQQLLWYGQYLHIGKGTTFGLGGYELCAEPWQESVRSKHE